jgi:hypothetical protein
MSTLMSSALFGKDGRKMCNEETTPKVLKSLDWQ